jgi:hypothetical protein
MPSTLTVAAALKQFLDTPNIALIAAGSPTQGEQLKQAFMDGMCAGVSLAVRAFEQSKAPAELHARLEAIALEIERIVPEQLAEPTLETAAAQGNA